MERSAREPMIEFIDVAPPNPGNCEEPTPPSSNRAASLVAVVAVLLALVLVGLAIASRPETPESAAETPRDSPASTSTILPSTIQTPPATKQIVGPIEPVGFVPWPEPPEDHDPNVTNVPGAGEPIFGAKRQSTIVYVNTQGRPTVIDLDTGSVSQVIVAATRRRDSFGVETGAVVALGNTSRSIPKATTRAIEFYTFRDELATTSDLQLAATAPGPLLCLSDLPCQVTGWQSATVTRGVDEYRHVTLEGDPEVYEALFGATWVVDGKYRQAPAGRADDLRLPVPMTDVAWIVHQPASGPTPADR